MIDASTSDPAAAATAWARRLYEAHVDQVYAYAARRVGPDLAADITADVFRVALEAPERYDRARGSEVGWLYGIATNLLRRHWRTEERRLRALGRHARTVAEPIDPLLQVDDRLTAADDASRLMDAVAALAPIDRDLLILATWQRAAHADVADALGISAGTVRSRLHRIRRELRAHMRAARPDREEPNQ